MNAIIGTAAVILENSARGRGGRIGLNAMYFSMIGVRDGVSSGSVTVWDFGYGAL